MEPRPTAEEQSIIQTAKIFAKEKVAPFAAEWEHERRLPTDVFRQAASAGLAAILVPKYLGGHEASYLTTTKILAELAGACYAFTFGLWVHNNLANTIARKGTPHQIERFLGPMLECEEIGAFCLTEPGAGSDAAAISTSALKSGSKWTLQGGKSWITNGDKADVFLVYAQTNPKDGWRGIAGFLIPSNAHGLQRTTPYALIGSHSLGVNDLILDECSIDNTGLLFGAGDGFKSALNGINLARTSVAAGTCGMLTASLQTALAYGRQRQAFGKPILENQGLQWQLADISTELEAARLLTSRAAIALDNGAPAIVESAYAKKYSTTVAFNGISQCMQIMGAEGLKTKYPLGRHLAMAKMAQYMDGTTEIQNTIISRTLLGE